MPIAISATARMILENARWVIAIEFVVAAQALEFHKPLEPGPGVKAALQAIRKVVPPLEADRILTPDVEAVRALMLSGAIRQAVESVIGRLG